MSKPAISGEFRVIDMARAAEFAEAWKDAAIPRLQWERCVQGELDRWRAGEPIETFETAVNAVRRIHGGGAPSLLDVGAASGYYSEIFKIAGLAVSYTGLDFSQAFADLAWQMFPGIRFNVSDALFIPYREKSFDIVFHSGCLLHDALFKDAIAEAARVSRKHVIFARTPIVEGPTRYYQKLAYGVPCLEIHFNQTELLRIFDRAGLKVVWQEDSAAGADVKWRTFLTEKAAS